MSDLKLFRIDSGVAAELTNSAVVLERHLQTLLERNMETLFGVRFLASEYSTGARHGGRVDSLGIDENGSPVIFEYKRSRDENVINQGLFYLDWLLDHQGEFALLVQQRLGAASAAEIDWSNPRLVCVAQDFTRYDEHAVQQINRAIELVRYRDYGGELLALELVTAVAGKPLREPSGRAQPRSTDAVAAERWLIILSWVVRRVRGSRRSRFRLSPWSRGGQRGLWPVVGPPGFGWCAVLSRVSVRRRCRGCRTLPARASARVDARRWCGLGVRGGRRR